MMASEVFLVVKADKRIAKNKLPYMTVQLRRKNGVVPRAITGMIWSDGLERANFEPSSGNFIEAWYEESEYQGRKQFVISRFVRAEGVNAEDFAEIGDVDPQVFYDAIFDRAWENPRFSAFIKNLKTFLEEETKNWSRTLKDILLEAPAGQKNHHARKGGLIQHIYEMVCLADQLAKENKETESALKRFWGFVDWELVVAACVVHDLAKVFEYNTETMLFEQTREAAFFGHSCLGVQLVDRCWEWKYDEIYFRLTHCILSHHGKIETGAATPPRIAEAVVVSLLDSMSCHLDIYETAERRALMGEAPEFSVPVGGYPVTSGAPRFLDEVESARGKK